MTRLIVLSTMLAGALALGCGPREPTTADAAARREAECPPAPECPAAPVSADCWDQGFEKERQARMHASQCVQISPFHVMPPSSAWMAPRVFPVTHPMAMFLHAPP